MTKKEFWWIRRDRQDGKETQIAITEVACKVEGYYIDTKLALSHACKENPLTTGFADYYPQ